jgi:hypothetical protein
MINPLANADNITASSQGVGTVAGAKKTGTGTASLVPSGSYTGANDKRFTIQCDLAGTVGSGATFRWKTSDTAVGTWEATGVAAVVGTTALGSEGFQINLSAGTMVLNDKWKAWAYAEVGPANLFVNDRDKYWKSGSLETLLTNGDFSTDATSWTPTDCTTASIAGGQSGNCLEITRVANTRQSVFQNFTTIAGEKYRIKVWVKSGTSGNEEAWLRVYDAGTLVESKPTTSGSWVEYELTFVAISTSTRLYLYKNTGTAGTMLFDTVSATLIPSLEIDLGSALAVDTVILADHNLSSTAVVTLAANSSSSWASPPYELDILSAANTDPSVDYISETYRYWKLFFDDVDNTDGFISIGKLYLGTYTQLAKVNINVDWGSIRSNARTRLRSVSVAGKARSKTLSDGEVFPTEYTLAPDADETTLRSIYDYTYKSGRDIYGNDKSIWVHYFNDEEALIFLCECMTDKYDVNYIYLNLKRVILQWREEIMTRVI